jgi:hypothetical protein
MSAAGMARPTSPPTPGPPMLTVLRRPKNGSHHFRFEWGDARLFLRFKRAWSVARIRADCSARVAAALSGLGAPGPAEALAKFGREFDRALANGWM